MNDSYVTGGVRWTVFLGNVLLLTLFFIITCLIRFHIHVTQCVLLSVSFCQLWVRQGWVWRTWTLPHRSACWSLLKATPTFVFIYNKTEPYNWAMSFFFVHWHLFDFWLNLDYTAWSSDFWKENHNWLFKMVSKKIRIVGIRPKYA